MMSEFKTQADIYKALLEGKTLTNTKSLVKLIDGNLKAQQGDDWLDSVWSFQFPFDWSVYTPPPEKLVVECGWHDIGVIHPYGLGITTGLSPFVGKKTRMTLEVIP